MTIAELEAWLKKVRDFGAEDNALVRVILGNGTVKEIDCAEPYNGSTGTPVLVLHK